MAQSYGYLARIGVDTSGLQQGLREVDAQIRSTDTEINQINRTLRQAQQAGTDTTQIMAQRQQVLNQQYEQTSERLRRLNEISEHMNNGLQNGTIDPEAYRSWQREIANTTARLQQLERQLNDTTEESTQLGNTFGDVLKADLVTEGIKALVGALKECADAIVDVCKESVQLSGQWEQLEGGIETLFGDDASTVIENAKNAFQTAGMSANQYASMAIQASSKLKKSLNDDTAATAKYIDMQATQISDIVNKMGVDMGSVSYAYQGFTRDNFTMLDNLAIGYAGTKAGMQELLDDAQKLSGVSYDIKKYNDILDAIQVIIEKQGIAGTTELESLTTLEGATARFENQLTNIKTEFGNEFRPIVTQFFNLLNDNIDEIEKVAEQLGGKVSEVLAEVFDDLKKFVESGGIEKIGNAMTYMIDHADEMVTIFGVLSSVLAADKIKNFAVGVEDLIGKFKGLAAAMQGATTAGANVSGAVQGAGAAASTSATAFAGYAAALILAVEAALKLKSIIDEAAEGLNTHSDAVQAIRDKIDELATEREAFSELVKSSPTQAWHDASDNIKKATDEIGYAQRQIEVLQNRINKGGVFDGSGNLIRYYTEAEIADMEKQRDTWNNYIIQEKAFQKENQDLLDKYNAQTIEKMEQNEKNRGKTSADVAAKIWEQQREKTEEEMKLYDSMLAKHQVTEEEYWAKRKAYLEAHRDVESEEWWKYYDAVTKHYDKLTEEEKKAAEKALKEQLDNAKKAAKEKYEELQRIRDLDDADEYDQKWFVDQLETLYKSFDEGSELYNEYYGKWINESNKYKKALEKDAKDEVKLWEKSADAVKKAVEDKYKKVEEAFDKAKSDLMGAIDLTEEVSKKENESAYALRGLVEPIYDARDGALNASGDKAKKKINDLNDEIKELEKYQKNLDRLKQTGISDQHMEKIMSMSYKDRADYIDSLMAMTDSQRNKYYAQFERYSSLASEVAEDTVEEQKKEAEQFEKAAEDMLNTTYENLSEEAKKQGKATAQAWIDGWAEVMTNTNTVLAGQMPQTSSKTQTQTAYEVAQTYATAMGGSASMQGATIVVNVGDKEAFRQIISDYNTEINLGGGIVGG